MIYDMISNITMYKGISAYLDKAIQFVEQTDLHTLPLGKTPIDGEHVFINVMKAQTKQEGELDFEIHKKYMDIQIDLRGTEMIQIATECGELVEAYAQAKDIGFFKAEVASSCVMGPGRFVVCMADELHKPGIQVGTSTAIKKCVIKVER
ncbi:MAG: YhcH/YjgK/YiaL family protein [Niameybacter sp.]|uniref:YhcH/YjgK/YiaL family protein n=1 Tax=Niameybacter sp. TaxID=2033640 RepID=UPI002FC61465